MKVWIDKQGGTHYHKEGCQIIRPTLEYQKFGKVITEYKLPPIIFHYEPIEHKVRRLGMPYGKEYGRIMIDKKLYYPCPICFGDKRK